MTACYGRPYPLVLPFTAMEAQGLSCRELAVEAGRLTQLRARMEYGESPEAGAFALLMEKMGFGRSMAHREALATLDRRSAGVEAAQRGWRCQERYGPVGTQGIKPKKPPPPEEVLLPDRPPPKAAPSRNERGIYRF